MTIGKILASQARRRTVSGRRGTPLEVSQIDPACSPVRIVCRSIRTDTSKVTGGESRRRW